MKLFNKLLIAFLILTTISSLIYSWRLERRLNFLHEALAQQTIIIEKLEKKITNVDNETILNQIEQAEVKGVATAIGKVSGIVKFTKPDSKETTIVCAYNKYTNNEFCTDELKPINSHSFKYLLEIPQGKYYIYATTPPKENKTYYSTTQKCSTDSCDNQQRIMLEVLENETQTSINLFE